MPIWYAAICGLCPWGSVAVLSGCLTFVEAHMFNSQCTEKETKLLLIRIALVRNMWDDRLLTLCSFPRIHLSCAATQWQVEIPQVSPRSKVARLGVQKLNHSFAKVEKTWQPLRTKNYDKPNVQAFSFWTELTLGVDRNASATRFLTRFLVPWFMREEMR